MDPATAPSFNCNGEDRISKQIDKYARLWQVTGGSWDKVVR